MVVWAWVLLGLIVPTVQEYAWVPGNWTSCTDSCTVPWQARPVQCMQDSVKVIDAVFCPEEPPPNARPCALTTGITYDFYNESSCLATPAAYNQPQVLFFPDDSDSWVCEDGSALPYGPPSGHEDSPATSLSVNTFYYLNAVPSGVVGGDSRWVDGPLINGSIDLPNRLCNFTYWVYGNGPASSSLHLYDLHVQVVQCGADGNDVVIELDTIVGSGGYFPSTTWQEMFSVVPVSVSGLYRVRWCVSGIVTAGSVSGSWALDDVTFSAGCVPAYATVSHTPTSSGHNWPPGLIFGVIAGVIFGAFVFGYAAYAAAVGLKVVTRRVKSALGIGDTIDKSLVGLHNIGMDSGGGITHSPSFTHRASIHSNGSTAGNGGVNSEKKQLNKSSWWRRDGSNGDKDKKSSQTAGKRSSGGSRRSNRIRAYDDEFNRASSYLSSNHTPLPGDVAGHGVTTVTVLTSERKHSGDDDGDGDGVVNVSGRHEGDMATPTTSTVKRAVSKRVLVAPSGRSLSLPDNRLNGIVGASVEVVELDGSLYPRSEQLSTSSAATQQQQQQQPQRRVSDPKTVSTSTATRRHQTQQQTSTIGGEVTMISRGMRHTPNGSTPIMSVLSAGTPTTPLSPSSHQSSFTLLSGTERRSIPMAIDPLTTDYPPRQVTSPTQHLREFPTSVPPSCMLPMVSSFEVHEYGDIIVDTNATLQSSGNIDVSTNTQLQLQLQQQQHEGVVSEVALFPSYPPGSPSKRIK